MVGRGRGGKSCSWLAARAEAGRRLVTRAGKGGGPIMLVEGRLEGRGLSLPARDADERGNGSSRRGGKAASAVSGRPKSMAVSGRSAET
jgi:hypothetical protein